MPRAGRHPLKSMEVQNDAAAHHQVTITTIVYVPMLDGYWRESLDVLKLFFKSLSANTSQPFDLMVFDNGSCEEVQNYLLHLKHSGDIQTLILSERNLKKLGALNFLLSAAPGDYVAYADSDIYFLPGWLDESLAVLEAFPRVGKVTAMPVLMDSSSPFFENIFRSALDAMEKDFTVQAARGKWIPDEYVNAHRQSLGEAAGDYLQKFSRREEILLQRGDRKVLVSGADFQFTMTREAVRQVLPLEIESPEEKGDIIYSPVLEARLADKGFWQVSTMDYLVHHMGNHVPNLAEELPWLDKTAAGAARTNPPKPAARSGLLKSLLKFGFVRRVLKKIHTLSYRMLFE